MEKIYLHKKTFTHTYSLCIYFANYLYVTTQKTAAIPLTFQSDQLMKEQKHHFRQSSTSSSLGRHSTCRSRCRASVFHYAASEKKDKKYEPGVQLQPRSGLFSVVHVGTFKLAQSLIEIMLPTFHEPTDFSSGAAAGSSMLMTSSSTCSC